MNCFYTSQVFFFTDLIYFLLMYQRQQWCQKHDVHVIWRMTNFQEMCNGSNSSEDFVTCVEQKTFGLRDNFLQYFDQRTIFCHFLPIKGLRDVLGDIPWNGEWLGLGATFGVFNGIPYICHVFGPLNLLVKKMTNIRCVQRGKPIWHSKLDWRIPLDLRGCLKSTLYFSTPILSQSNLFTNVFHQRHQMLEKCIRISEVGIGVIMHSYS